MFCSQCGKKVKENMLFCPFCGSPIVIPEQDEEEIAVAAAEAPAEQTKPAEPMRSEVKPAQEQTAQKREEEEKAEETAAQNESEDMFRLDFGWEDQPEEKAEEEPFIPLDLDALMAHEAEAGGEEDAEADDAEDEEADAGLRVPRMDTPVKLQGRVPNLVGVQGPQTGGSQRCGAGKSQLRAFDPDDIFLDGGDRYDAEEEPDEYDEYGDDENERGSFFVRHVRGVVTFSLFAVVVIVVVGWLFSGAGQTSLAKANLAWDPVVYAELAREAYQEGQYAVSGGYYERALERDADSYDYANSAGIAYYYAGDTARAVEMAKCAIGLDATRYESYQLLLYLYPDVNTRPWDVSTLLQQGYRLTGREELKPS